MESSASLIQSLEENIKLIIKQKEELKQQLSVEKQNNVHLKNINSAQAEEIEQLDEKIKVLKIAGKVDGDENENKEVELKINDLVREIDKCIAQVNR